MLTFRNSTNVFLNSPTRELSMNLLYFDPFPQRYGHFNFWLVRKPMLTSAERVKSSKQCRIAYLIRTTRLPCNNLLLLDLIALLPKITFHTKMKIFYSLSTQRANHPLIFLADYTGIRNGFCKDVNSKRNSDSKNTSAQKKTQEIWTFLIEVSFLSLY